MEQTLLLMITVLYYWLAKMVTENEHLDVVEYLEQVNKETR